MIRPHVVAHRGASAEEPENSPAAFRRALALGVDGIELDARVTRDGVAIVCHDANLRRLTGWNRRCDRVAWSEISALNASGRPPVPRLVEVLRMIGRRAMVQVEIKPGVPVAPVIGAIRTARAASAVILASFSPVILRRAARIAPAWPRMLIISGRTNAADLARRLTALGASGVSVDHRALTSAAWLNELRGHGFAVWAWTVNRPAVARRLHRLGVTALVGDDPALLQRSLRR